MMRLFDRTRRTRLLLVFLVVLSLVIISIGFRSKDGNSPLDKFGRVALSVLAPVQKGLVTIFRPVGHFFAGFTQVPSMRARIATLEKLNGAQLLQLEQFEDIKRENERLRALMQLPERLGLKTKAARVTGVGPSNFGRTIFIDKGSRQGVHKNMPVIGGDGLVGRVIDVTGSESTVQLLLDRGSNAAGRLATTGEQGLAQGRGSGTLDFELLDPEANVHVGDKVVTSGYDQGLYPPGLPIGTVIQAPPAGSNTSRIVKVEPFVDFSSLDYVLLVIGETKVAKK